MRGATPSLFAIDREMFIGVTTDSHGIRVIETTSRYDFRVFDIRPRKCVYIMSNASMYTLHEMHNIKERFTTQGSIL